MEPGRLGHVDQPPVVYTDTSSARMLWSRAHRVRRAAACCRHAHVEQPRVVDSGRLGHVVQQSVMDSSRLGDIHQNKANVSSQKR